MSLGKMSVQGAGNGWHSGERYCWLCTTCRTTTSHWYDGLQAGFDGVLSHSSAICISSLPVSQKATHFRDWPTSRPRFPTGGFGYSRLQRLDNSNVRRMAAFGIYFVVLMWDRVLTSMKDGSQNRRPTTSQYCWRLPCQTAFDD